MDLLGMASLITGIISIAYAIYTSRELKKVKEHQIKNLRSTLKDSIVAMSQSYKVIHDPAKYNLTNSEALKRLTAAHTSSAAILRSMFEELSKIDIPYDNNRLNGYVISGLITSEWVWKQAATFVANQADLSMPTLPEETPD